MQERKYPFVTPFTCSRRRAVAALGLVGALGLAPPAWAQFRVQISGVGATQIPIAIGTFRDEARGPQPISAIVRADLERSGLFRSLDASADRLDEVSRPPLADWKTKGADALLACWSSRKARMQHAGASSETLPKPENPLNLLP